MEVLFYKLAHKGVGGNFFIEGGPNTVIATA